MPRARILKTIIEKIDTHKNRKIVREEFAKQKQAENQERQRRETEERRAEKEAQRIAARKQLLETRIQEALGKGEITEEDAVWLSELDTDRVVGWSHVPYIDHLTKLRTQMDNGEWKEVCLYLSDKKDYNPLFTQYVRTLFNEQYSFEEYRPHENPYRKRKKKTKNEKEIISDEDAEDVSTVRVQQKENMQDEVRKSLKEKITEEYAKRVSDYEPWADNLYDACAPHLVVTHKGNDGEYKFGLMTIWRNRFTKHGLSMMARSQFLKVKLFEQEIDIPVFMIIGIGGTALKPEQLFIVPFSEIENHFIPKPIAYRYETTADIRLHFIPELRKLK